MVKLSASKLKLHQDCSLAYWFKYIKKLPNEVGDGGKRGSISHLILEYLFKEKRRKIVENILKEKNTFSYKPVERLCRNLAKKLGCNTEDNLNKINAFILTGLTFDFFCDEAIKSSSEERFDVKTDKYHIIGIIDKTAIYEDKVVVTDFKSSKGKFSKEEIEFNIQALMYGLVQKQRFPDKKIEVNFLFLKMKRNPVQTVVISDEILTGFELWLEYMTDYLSDFNYDKALANLAISNVTKRWHCDKEIGSFNKEGAPSHICSFKYPFVYFAAVKDGEVHFTAYDKKSLDKYKKQGYVIEEKMHEGCPAHKKLWKNQL